MPNKIKKLRERRGLSQAQLARELQISVSYLNQIENNKRDPSIKLAVRIAKLLDTTLDDIFLY